MTPEELGWVIQATWKRLERERRERLEEGRLLAVLQMQPHCSGRLDPREVLPFVWEREEDRAEAVPDKESARRAVSDFLSRLR